MSIIMAAANCSPVIASRRANYDGDFRVPTLLDAQPLDHAARVHQRTTHSIDMAIKPEEGGKLAHKRLQIALPVCTKIRRQIITPGGTPGPLCRSDPGPCQTAISPLRGRGGFRGHQKTCPRRSSRAVWTFHPLGGLKGRLLPNFKLQGGRRN